MVEEEAASVCVPRGCTMHRALCPGVSAGVSPTPLTLRVLSDRGRIKDPHTKTPGCTQTPGVLGLREAGGPGLLGPQSILTPQPPHLSKPPIWGGATRAKSMKSWKFRLREGGRTALGTG